jgi:hypothetical protein
MRCSLLSLAAVSCVALAPTARAADLYLFPAFVPAGAGMQLNHKVNGVGFLLYNGTEGTTTVFVDVKKLEPNTTFGIKFGFDDSGASNPQAFSSGSSGRVTYVENYNTVLDPNAGGPVRMLIYVWDGDFETVDDVTPAELRAAGVSFQF